MIDFFEEIDRGIVSTINGWNSPFIDEFMWIVSAKLTWFPVYFLLAFLAYKKMTWKEFGFFMLGVLVAVSLADLTSVHLFKNTFLRYRPSHHALLSDILHYYEIKPGEFYKGGQYGFVSSHAANFFAIIGFTILTLRPLYSRYLSITLLALGVLVCYSRIYLGVHYLSDVLVGALVGLLLAYLSYRYIYRTLTDKYVRS
jgi:undecaprenyl-diphosphatase